MSIFKFTLPSGKTFVVNGPAGATKEQAEIVFYNQVASGSLVGYAPGDTLANPVETLANFGLDRLDRGTAGVDDLTTLAIVSGLPIVASVPTLTTVEVENMLTQADIVLENGPVEAIGPLDENQVKALLAQTALDVDQDYNQISQDKGIGKYGMNSAQLEKIGYLKPGTTDRFLNGTKIDQANPSNFVEVMNSPSVWAGKNNIKKLDSFLTNSNAQTRAQIELIQAGYNSLTASGLIKDTTPQPVSITTGQVYTQNSAGGVLQKLSALTLLTGALSLPGGLSGVVNSVLSGAKTLGNLASNTFGGLTSGTGNVLGNISSLASNAVDKIGSLASGALGNVGNLASSALAGIGSITTKLTENAGALMQNITKFGYAATASWSKGLSVGNLGGALDSIGKGAQMAVNFATSKLTALVSDKQAGAGFSGTVSRASLDAAVSRVIGNPKIPTPGFGVPGPDAQNSVDIAQAQSILKSLGQNTSFNSLNVGGVSVGTIVSTASAITNTTESLLASTGINTKTASGALTSSLSAISGSSTPASIVGTSLTGSTASASTNFASRQAAIDNMEIKKAEYEVLVAQYGRLDARTIAALDAYKAAVAYLNNFS